MGRFWFVDSDGKRKRTEEGTRREYELYQSSAKAKAERASRNSARREALRKGRVSLGDNKDIHHPNGVMDNSRTQVLPASVNRGKREKSRLKRSARKKRR